MSDRLTRRLYALSHDTAGVRMPPGAAIRKRGDQRGRRQVVATTLAVFALLAVVSAGVFTFVDRRASGPLPPGESPSPTLSVPATVSATPTGSPTPGRSSIPTAPPVTSIPVTALLQPADLKLAGSEAMPEQMQPTELARFRPCGTAFPSDAQRTASRRQSATIFIPSQAGEQPTGFEQQLYGYRGEGARAFMAQAIGDVRRCPGTLSETQSRWTVVDERFAGDESLLVRVSQLYRHLDDQPPTEKSRYVAVVRVGNLVIILVDHGWESGGGHEDIVRRLVPAALQRAANVR